MAHRQLLYWEIPQQARGCGPLLRSSSQISLSMYLQLFSTCIYIFRFQDTAVPNCKWWCRRLCIGGMLCVIAAFCIQRTLYVILLAWFVIRRLCMGRTLYFISWFYIGRRCIGRTLCHFVLEEWQRQGQSLHSEIIIKSRKNSLFEANYLCSQI